MTQSSSVGSCSFPVVCLDVDVDVDVVFSSAEDAVLITRFRKRMVNMIMGPTFVGVT